MVDVGEGSQATMGVLPVLAREIARFYISKGYLLSCAYIPARKIKDGTVRIQIKEGQVDRVEVVGAQTVGGRDLQRGLRAAIF